MFKKGLVHLYTGDGKGKTTAALGLAMRAAGHDKSILLVQFLKTKQSGEDISTRFINNIDLKEVAKSDKYFFQLSAFEKEDVRKKIKREWKELKKIIIRGEYDLIILDEITSVVNNGIIPADEISGNIKKRASGVEIVMTGKDASRELTAISDYVTQMQMIRHPNNIGSIPRVGIEY